MQSPSTGNVQLPSLFDLLAPPTSSGVGGQSMFDTLLRPPAPAPTPPNDAGGPTSRNDNQAKRPDDNSPPSAAPPGGNKPSTDAGQQQHEENAGAHSPADPSPADPSPAAHSKAQDKSEPAAQDNVTAESLAGMVAVRPAAAVAESSAAEQAGNASASATTSAKTKAATGSPATQAAPSGDTGDAATEAASAEAADAKQKAAAAKTPLAADEPAKGKSGQAQPAAATASTLASGEEATKPAIDATTGALTPSNGKAADNQQAGHHGDSVRTDLAPPIQPAALDPTAQSPAANSTTPAAAPVAVPLAAPAAAGNSPAPGLSSANATSPLGAATQTRSRLPAEALAPSPRASDRTAPTEIDTARLLSRVAKAFTAAQDRDGEVRLRLSPPELGSLRLEVRVQDGALVAHLHTETDSARTALIDNLPTLRDRLAEQGVRIERFDVDLMQRQPGGSPDQPGSRQQDVPAPPRLAPPPKPRTAAADPPAALAPASAANGLNIII